MPNEQKAGLARAAYQFEFSCQLAPDPRVNICQHHDCKWLPWFPIVNTIITMASNLRGDNPSGSTVYRTTDLLCAELVYLWSRYNGSLSAELTSELPHLPTFG
jgi:hypothetical protein